MMKKIAPLFLGLALLIFTGCPPQAPPPPPSPDGGTQPVVIPGTTSIQHVTATVEKVEKEVAKDVSKEVGEAVKEVKEAAVAVGEVVAEKAKDAVDVAKDTAGKAVEAAKETAEKAVETVTEKAKEVAKDASALVTSAEKEVAKDAAAVTGAAADATKTTADTAKAADDAGKDAVKAVETKAADTVAEVKDAAKETAKAAETKAAEVAADVKDAAKETVKAAETKAADAVAEVKDTAKEAAKAAETKVADAAKAADNQLGDITGKTPQIAGILKGFKEKRAFDAAKNSKNKPKVYSTLPEDLHNPDGMTVNEKTGTLFLNVPNFNGRPDNKGAKLHNSFLVKVNADGSVEKLMEFEKVEGIQVDTKQIGPMGLDFGPDGHLYVCDNQYFFDTNNKSRILRVLMDGDKPTGKVEIVVEGTKLSNAILWLGDKLLLTDTFLDLDGKFGSGCVWMFSKDEALKAGTEGNPPIKVKPVKAMGDDPHCITIQEVKQVPGGGNGGADGMTADSNGVVYFGNFGNGEMYRIVFDAENKATVDVIHPAGEYFHCCDGIYFDKGTNKVFVTDSACNAVHAFTPPAAGEMAKFETIWENADTDGADGSLDQPCEPVVIGKKLILANFDWPFPELINSKFEAPSTLSVIDLE